MKFAENIKNRVKELLENEPEYRDSDLALIARILWEDALASGKFDDSEMKVVVTLLNLLKSKDTPNPESIRRIRCKLQEEFAHLRGDLYWQRQGRLQDESKDDLGYTVHKDVPAGQVGMNLN